MLRPDWLVDGRVEAIGRPITRAEVQAMVTTAVTSELKAQAPELVEQRLRDRADQFPNGFAGNGWMVIAPASVG